MLKAGEARQIAEAIIADLRPGVSVKEFLDAVQGKEEDKNKDPVIKELRKIAANPDRERKIREKIERRRTQSASGGRIRKKKRR